VLSNIERNQNWINEAFANHGDRENEITAVLNSKLQVAEVLGDKFESKWKLKRICRLQSKCFCLSKNCLNFSNPFSLFFGPIYRPRMLFNVFWSCTAGGESGRETGQNCFRSWGRLILPNPWRASQGVTVCLSRVLTAWHAGDGWVVLKDDGQPVIECDGRHPEAWQFRTCSFLRFLAEFRRFCAWRPLLLCTWKYNQTTSITKAKTSESRPKLHTKRVEIVLCFACYQTPLHLNHCLSSSNF